MGISKLGGVVVQLLLHQLVAEHGAELVKRQGLAGAGADERIGLFLHVRAQVVPLGGDLRFGKIDFVRDFHGCCSFQNSGTEKCFRPHQYLMQGQKHDFNFCGATRLGAIAPALCVHPYAFAFHGACPSYLLRFQAVSACPQEPILRCFPCRLAPTGGSLNGCGLAYLLSLCGLEQFITFCCGCQRVFRQRRKKYHRFRKPFRPFGLRAGFRGCPASMDQTRRSVPPGQSALHWAISGYGRPPHTDPISRGIRWPPCRRS